LVRPSTFACTTVYIETLAILPEHTHTKINKKLNRWLKVLYVPFLPFIHHSHQTQPANAHPFSSCSHTFDTACKMFINQNSKMEMEKRGEDLEVWNTHCLPHHLPDGPNADYLSYPVVSQEAITCNNTLITPQRSQSREHENWIVNQLSIETPQITSQ